jgi:hypothetical protein
MTTTKHQHRLADDLDTLDRCTCGLRGYIEGAYVRDRNAEREEARRQWSLRTTEDRMIDSENRARRYRSTGR